MIIFNTLYLNIPIHLKMIGQFIHSIYPDNNHPVPPLRSMNLNVTMKHYQASEPITLGFVNLYYYLFNNKNIPINFRERLPFAENQSEGLVCNK